MSIHRAETYPFRGIVYLLSHRNLWNSIACGLLLMLLVSLICSILLFVFVFPIQSLALSEYMSEWLSWLISFFLTLFEIALIILIFSSLYLSYYMDIIFDAVWRQETMGINQGESQRISSNHFSCIKSFFILILFRVLLLLGTSPLNLIPILGTILYIYINGYYYAWSLHCRYFHLLGLSFAQGKHYVQQNHRAYRHFGIVAILFEMIPFVNLITPITNVIGSALWACDIERFEEPSTHPRTYLLGPSPTSIEQGQTDYGTNRNEKQSPPPTYEDVLQNDLYPSAPPDEKQ